MILGSGVHRTALRVHKASAVRTGFWKGYAEVSTASSTAAPRVNTIQSASSASEPCGLRISKFTAARSTEISAQDPGENALAGFARTAPAARRGSFGAAGRRRYKATGATLMRAIAMAVPPFPPRMVARRRGPNNCCRASLRLPPVRAMPKLRPRAGVAVRHGPPAEGGGSDGAAGTPLPWLRWPAARYARDGVCAEAA